MKRGKDLEANTKESEEHRKKNPKDNWATGLNKKDKKEIGEIMKDK